MRWFAIIALVGALAACGRCGANGDPSALPTVTDDSGEVVTDVPMPGAIYKDAFARARSEVNADNARKRLDELERAIDREADAMR
jgi:hypothetical protein